MAQSKRPKLISRQSISHSNMALQQKLHALPKRDRPQTDYEQWMKEHDASYELSGEPQYDANLKQPPVMPSSSGRDKSTKNLSHGSH
ncbi:hypothetical protein N7499_013339 [Penicillium canescens]|uniref:Uncharacterized protein n=1 Tax=Penicillium canescens TaxID=5083 RepID=A0AAD6I5C2_PENCN|nr:uncharacterized protein N7446_000012 [Penicillium canescens]KAJ6011687.1 hypothetical protein N7522_002042 [Penicillium canescens]KAJ6030922.1 hypothetical protein N7460_011188 [Penicillium canescens]KAJ6059358.1 hypothetical protein N7444_002997 [Penicillium canescens]KAJ6064659.1 hypothetical protein N7499_013339 [Penicillium canescens]KAJ6077076.1 hypothetical protein N7446_000012 [Penicillium canescens]